MATTATSSTFLFCAPSNCPVCLNSCAMIGQSVVHTGSRKVISTTLPRRLASETVRPSWSVSVKLGAGRSRLALLPAMARARIGSAVRFAAAEAIGAAPIKITTSAATAATDRALAVASAPPSA